MKKKKCIILTPKPMPGKFIAHQFSITPGTDTRAHICVVQRMHKTKLVLAASNDTLHLQLFFFLPFVPCNEDEARWWVCGEEYDGGGLVVVEFANARASHNLQAVPFGCTSFLSVLLYLRRLFLYCIHANILFSDYECFCFCCRWRLH